MFIKNGLGEKCRDDALSSRNVRSKPWRGERRRQRRSANIYTYQLGDVYSAWGLRNPGTRQQPLAPSTVSRIGLKIGPRLFNHTPI